MNNEPCPACGSTKRDGEKPDPDVGMDGWCICTECGLEVESKGWNEAKRLRALEQAVRALRLADISPAVWVHTWATIGQLLEGDR